MVHPLMATPLPCGGIPAVGECFVEEHVNPLALNNTSFEINGTKAAFPLQEFFPFTHCDVEQRA